MFDMKIVINGKERAVHELLHEMYNLTKSQIVLMYLLAKAGRPLTIDEISRMVSSSKLAIRNALNDLVNKGFVHKMPNPWNKRENMYYVVKEEIIERIKRDYEKLAVHSALS